MIIIILILMIIVLVLLSYLFSRQQCHCSYMSFFKIDNVLWRISTLIIVLQQYLLQDVAVVMALIAAKAC